MERTCEGDSSWAFGIAILLSSCSFRRLSRACLSKSSVRFGFDVTLIRWLFVRGDRVPAGTEATACIRKTAPPPPTEQASKEEEQPLARLLLNGVDVGVEALSVESGVAVGSAETMMMVMMGDYVCVEGLTQRAGDAEHVLLRTA
jgi:hypothetical protein